MNILAYADDLLIFSKTVIGLQELLNDISKRAELLGFTLNEEKTQTMVFRPAHLRARKDP